jgi:23S rRNA (cytosine1962-C5)-methyltransferase
MKRIILKPGEEARIRSGHPWVYDNEVARLLKPQPGGKTGGNRTTIDGRNTGGGIPIGITDLEAGETADVESSRKEYLGRAIVNPNSKIIARIYSPSKEGLDKGFFKRRVREALARRVFAGYDLGRENARIVFGEADLLPGLIVDRFVGWPFGLTADMAALSLRPLSFEALQEVWGPPASWLSMQFLAWGMDARRDEILAALDETLGKDGLGAPAGIVEKSASRVRELEGLAPREGLIQGSFPAEGIVVFENGLPFLVHVEEGQKTGHFLDQRDNRRRAAAWAARLCGEAGKGVRVLDACAYTGGFGIHAARASRAAEPAEVICVDVSRTALETLRMNAALNGLEDRISAVEADVFDYLRGAERRREKFDLIVLDPPAFAKSKSALEGALRGYKEINLRAISLLRPGGVLVSCSCSQTLDEGRFKRMITEAPPMRTGGSSNWTSAAKRRITPFWWATMNPAILSAVSTGRSKEPAAILPPVMPSGSGGGTTEGQTCSAYRTLFRQSFQGKIKFRRDRVPVFSRSSISRASQGICGRLRRPFAAASGGFVSNQSYLRSLSLRASSR